MGFDFMVQIVFYTLPHLYIPTVEYRGGSVLDESTEVHVIIVY